MIVHLVPRGGGARRRSFCGVDCIVAAPRDFAPELEACTSNPQYADCPKCRSLIKPFALQIDPDGDGWETDRTFDDFQEAAELAKAHRDDGIPARVAKWCASCERYTGNFAGEQCGPCSRGVVPAHKVLCRACGRPGHVFCASVPLPGEVS
jgi:hypothetical protein